MSWRRLLGRSTSIWKDGPSHFRLEVGDGETDQSMWVSSGIQGRRESQAMAWEPPCFTWVKVELWPSRRAEFCFSTSCSAKRNFCEGIQRLSPNKSSNRFFCKFHLGPLKKNDTKPQLYVKQEKSRHPWVSEILSLTILCVPQDLLCTTESQP